MMKSFCNWFNKIYTEKHGGHAEIHRGFSLWPSVPSQRTLSNIKLLYLECSFK
jgi:hypothetical protein